MGLTPTGNQFPPPDTSGMSAWKRKPEPVAVQDCRRARFAGMGSAPVLTGTRTDSFLGWCPPGRRAPSTLRIRHGPHAVRSEMLRGRSEGVHREVVFGGAWGDGARGHALGGHGGRHDWVLHAVLGSLPSFFHNLLPDAVLWKGREAGVPALYRKGRESHPAPSIPNAAALRSKAQFRGRQQKALHARSSPVLPHTTGSQSCAFASRSTKVVGTKLTGTRGRRSVGMKGGGALIGHGNGGHGSASRQKETKWHSVHDAAMGRSKAYLYPPALLSLSSHVCFPEMNLHFKNKKPFFLF